MKPPRSRRRPRAVRSDLPACGATSVVDEEALLDGEPVCPNCGKPLDFEVTEE